MSVHRANPIIIGGGPCGTFTAALLNSYNIPVTLIERNSADAPLNVPRSYEMRIGQRGRHALSLIPDLLAQIRASATPMNSMRSAWIAHDTKTGTSPIQQLPVNAGLDFIITRHTLVHKFTDFVANCKHVTAMYDTMVTDIRPRTDCSFDVVMSKQDGVTETLNASLLIACDGLNSAVAKSLTAVISDSTNTNPLLKSSNGLGLKQYPVQYPEIYNKTIAINPTLIRVVDCKLPTTSAASQNGLATIRILRGDPCYTQGIAQFVIFPQAPDADLAKAGIATASIIAHKSHDIWKLDNLRDAYSFFEHTFPQLDVGAYISQDDMNMFVQARAMPFPGIARRNSLAAHFEESDSAGVIFLGDAAHSNPPSIGQGVNAAFQDVETLAQVLNESPADASTRSIVELFERKRNIETSALVQMACLMQPSLRQSRLRVMLYHSDQIVRKILARYIPGIYPGFQDLLWTDLPFSEVVRRVQVTTLRLKIGFVALVLIPMVVLLSFG